MTALGPRPARCDVQLVPMRRRHLRGVVRIEDAVYPRPWSRSLFAGELGRGDRRYVVALGPRARSWRPRPVLGYAGAIITTREAHIATVAVHPSEHRRKLGTRLVAAVLRAAIDRGATSATLEVRTSNLGAQRLYEAFGFVGVGVRPGYYAETGEDALIMWAYDLQSAGFAERLAEQELRVTEPGGSSGAPDLVVPWVRDRIGLGGDRADEAQPSIPPRRSDQAQPSPPRLSDQAQPSIPPRLSDPARGR